MNELQQSEEMAMMTELSHLEGIITQLDKHTADPFSLPLSTEQVAPSFAYHLHIICISAIKSIHSHMENTSGLDY